MSALVESPWHGLHISAPLHTDLLFDWGLSKHEESFCLLEQTMDPQEGTSLRRSRRNHQRLRRQSDTQLEGEGDSDEGAAKRAQDIDLFHLLGVAPEAVGEDGQILGESDNTSIGTFYLPAPLIDEPSSCPPILLPSGRDPPAPSSQPRPP